MRLAVRGDLGGGGGGGGRFVGVGAGGAGCCAAASTAGSALTGASNFTTGYGGGGSDCLGHAFAATGIVSGAAAAAPDAVETSATSAASCCVVVAMLVLVVSLSRLELVLLFVSPSMVSTVLSSMSQMLCVAGAGIRRRSSFSSDAGSTSTSLTPTGVRGACEVCVVQMRSGVRLSMGFAAFPSFAGVVKVDGVV